MDRRGQGERVVAAPREVAHAVRLLRIRPATRDGVAVEADRIDELPVTGAVEVTDEVEAAADERPEGLAEQVQLERAVRMRPGEETGETLELGEAEDEAVDGVIDEVDAALDEQTADLLTQRGDVRGFERFGFDGGAVHEGLQVR